MSQVQESTPEVVEAETVNEDAVRDLFFNGSPETETSEAVIELKEALEAKMEPAEEAKTESESENELSFDKATEPVEETKAEEVKAEPETEAPKEPLIEFKVNGKMESMTLTEIQENFPQIFDRLKNEVSGEKEIARRFTELDKKEKKVYNTINEIKSYLEEFGNKVKDGNIAAGFEYFGQFANVPGHVVKEQLLAWATPEVLRRQNIPSELIDYELQMEELEYNRALQESKAKKLAAEQAAFEAELRATELTRLRETHNIDEDAWNSAFSELEREVPESEPITPQMVIDRAKQSATERQALSWSTEIAKSENLSVADFEDLKAVALKYPQFTKEDLLELVREAKKELEQAESKKQVENKLVNKLSAKDTSKGMSEVDIKSLKAAFGVFE